MAALATVMAISAGAAEFVNILTGGTSGVYYPLGNTLSSIYSKALPRRHGDEEMGFKGKLDKLRTIAAIYPNYVQIVASEESGIKSLADLTGTTTIRPCG